MPGKEDNVDAVLATEGGILLPSCSSNTECFIYKDVANA